MTLVTMVLDADKSLNLDLHIGIISSKVVADTADNDLSGWSVTDSGGKIRILWMRNALQMRLG